MVTAAPSRPSRRVDGHVTVEGMGFWDAYHFDKDRKPELHPVICIISHTGKNSCG